MKETRERDIEKLLGSVTPASAPPGLRDRILGEAARELSKRAASPAVRASFGGCAALALIVVVADWALGRAENARLAAFAGPERRTESQAAVGTALEDVLSGMPLLARKLAARPEARPRSGSRSWDPLKEDFDGGQDSENHN